MVQSEDEKRLRKQVRKEEKKLNKILSSKMDETDDQDFQFDPIDLRTKRQAALANAMSQPMFKERAGSSGTNAAAAATVEQFPFVFDSQNSAKSTAGN